MDLRLHDSGCWQARCGDVHMGCTLSLEELRELSPRLLTQVHGTLIHDDLIYRDEKTCGDGLVSDRAGVALVIKTADCVPVTFSDGHRIGAIHAGWRGTAAGIVSRLAEHFQPERLFAVIGPAISADNYEVDADLYADWLERDSRLAAFLAPAPAGGSKRLFDLKGMVRDHLLRLGVPSDRIETVPACTYASSLPSYRRTGSPSPPLFSYIYRQATAPV